MAYDLSDYVDVAERVQKFHETYPEGSLQSEWRLTELNGVQTIVVKARAYRSPDDKRPGIGHATEPVPGLTKFTQNSELMVGETSAWGRALAALGFEVKRGIASREEVMNRSEANGGADDSLFQPSTGAPVGFASDKQRKYFDVLLGKSGWNTGERATVTRYVQESGEIRASDAIDALKEDADSLLAAAAKWESTLSDVPFDDDA